MVMGVIMKTLYKVAGSIVTLIGLLSFCIARDEAGLKRLFLGACVIPVNESNATLATQEEGGWAKDHG